MNNELKLFEQDDYVKGLLKYPMLKLADDISKKYSIKYIKPCYHSFLAYGGTRVLDGYHVVFMNELVLSVQFGSGNYASNREKRLSMFWNVDSKYSFLEISDNAEIAIFRNEDEGLIYIDEWNDSVLGYQTPDEIMQVIDKYILGDLLNA